jgi:hypothetical protein
MERLEKGDENGKIGTTEKLPDEFKGKKWIKSRPENAFDLIKPKIEIKPLQNINA